jgi:hypothetical protein
VLRAWGNRIALPSERIAQTRKLLEDAFEPVTDEISEVLTTEILVGQPYFVT